MALYALAARLFGPTDPSARDLPEAGSHPYFPDQFWPYPVIAIVALVSLGLLAALGQAMLVTGPAADPRSTVIPHPDWYFLALFQLVKLGPPLITSYAIPGLVGLALLAWPLLDQAFGPRLARRLGWASWPAPGRNPVSGTIWLAGIAAWVALTVWAISSQ